MHIFKNSLYLIPVTILLVGCGNTGSSDSTGGSSKTKNVLVSATPYVQSVGMSHNVRVNVALGDSPKDVYILLSNYANNASNVKIKRKKIVEIDERKKIIKEGNTLSAQSSIIHAPKEVETFRRNISTLLNQSSNTPLLKHKYITRRTKAVGSQDIFYTNQDTSEHTVATSKKVVTVSTPFGEKTLNIWVSNDSFGAGCAKARCVTQSMVNALANTFLKAGNDNDIYDWVTNIYGAEWGGHSDTSLIPADNEISILLTDIGNDNSTSGGVVGYYYAKDNFKKSKLSGSNERLMFYADAVLFANAEGSWSINDFWPKEMISTLAHEFEHMIHFYQKTTLRTGHSTDTWIDEMLAESTEDLVASKIRHTGPRGVPYTLGSAGDSGNRNGRYPSFNANNRLSLTTWNNRLADYAKVSAFGAYLLRNYGGAKVLHDVMHNNYTDEQAVLSAIGQAVGGSGKTLDTLLREWGIAVLLSDNNHLSGLPTYNSGGYIPNSYNGSVYQLGSINFFNYAPQPKVSSSSGNVEAKGNFYYLVGKGLRGDISFEVSLKNNIEATLIVK